MTVSGEDGGRAQMRTRASSKRTRTGDIRETREQEGGLIERRRSGAMISETESQNLMVYRSESARKADAPVLLRDMACK